MANVLASRSLERSSSKLLEDCRSASLKSVSPKAAHSSIAVVSVPTHLNMLQHAYIPAILEAAVLSRDSPRSSELLCGLLDGKKLMDSIDMFEHQLGVAERERFDANVLGVSVALSACYRRAVSFHTAGAWVVGLQRFGLGLGHKRVEWRYRKQGGDGCLVAGVLSDAGCQALQAGGGVTNACDRRGFFGWGSKNGSVCVDGAFAQGVGGYPRESDVMFHNEAFSVALDFAEGTLTLTTHDQQTWRIEQLPVCGGQLYRACVQLSSSRVLLEGCSVEFL